PCYPHHPPPPITFLFNDTSTPEIYTLSLHDALPIYGATALSNGNYVVFSSHWNGERGAVTWGNSSLPIRGTVSNADSLVGTNPKDRKSTRLNSSHGSISYAVFCLKKKITIASFL